MTLNNKRKAFVAEYLKAFNATRSAIAAGYSEKTARSYGQQLLTNIDIAEAIRSEIAERSMGSDEVLTRLADIARGDMADLMALTTSGYSFELMIDNPNDPGQKIPNPKTKLIKHIHQKVTTILAKKEDGEDREIIDTELELYSAHEALRDLGKHLKLFTDNVDITSGGEPLKGNNAGYDRAITSLADALREAVSRTDAKQESLVVTAEQASMVGALIEGG